MEKVISHGFQKTPAYTEEIIGRDPQKDPAFTEKVIGHDHRKDAVSQPIKAERESASEGGNQDIVVGSR